MIQKLQSNLRSNTIDFSLNSTGKLLNQRYYLYELIAETNYRQVYLARDVIKHRKCAIKQLWHRCYPKEVEQTVKLMFQQEAEILQKLAGKHDRICQFYNYFNDANSLYLVQEWIPGITLEQKLRSQSKLSEAETKKILLNLLPVLDCIHNLGIIHRDIKPSNIILRSEDNLPVLIDQRSRAGTFVLRRCTRDFGVAQISDRHQPKTIVETPGYISLKRHERVTYSEDLCSLALTAIQLLTGQSSIERDFQHQQLSTDSNLTTAIERGISPQPERQFASAQEMRSALLPNNSINMSNNENKSRLKPWLLSSIFGLQIYFAWMSWGYLISELDEQPPIDLGLFPEESLIPTDNDELVATDNIFQAAMFVLGTFDREVLQALGEPVWRKPGFWTNSVAWSYENVIAEGIDLGYIFDSQTNQLRQIEIAVPPTTSYDVVQSALNSLVANQFTFSLEKGLQAVYQRRQATYTFTLEDLEGIVQRNDYDRIYMAVWLEDFHD